MVLNLKAMMAVTLKTIAFKRRTLKKCDLQVKLAELERERAARMVQETKERQQEVKRALDYLEKDAL